MIPLEQLFLFSPHCAALTWQGARGGQFGGVEASLRCPLGDTCCTLLLLGEGKPLPALLEFSTWSSMLSFPGCSLAVWGFFSQGVSSDRCPVAASFSVCLLRCRCPAGLWLSVCPYLLAFWVWGLPCHLVCFFFLYCPSTLGFALYYLERLKIRLASHPSSQNPLLNRHLKHYK